MPREFFSKKEVPKYEKHLLTYLAQIERDTSKKLSQKSII